MPQKVFAYNVKLKKSIESHIKMISLYFNQFLRLTDSKRSECLSSYGVSIDNTYFCFAVFLPFMWDYRSEYGWFQLADILKTMHCVCPVLSSIYQVHLVSSLKYREAEKLSNPLTGEALVSHPVLCLCRRVSEASQSLNLLSCLSSIAARRLTKIENCNCKMTVLYFSIYGWKRFWEEGKNTSGNCTKFLHKKC